MPTKYSITYNGSRAFLVFEHWNIRIKMNTKEQKEASKAKHSKYEGSAKRKQVLSIRTSKADKVEEWDSIVTWLQEQGDGTAKDGLYQFAKKNEII
jgi:type II secretory pathway component HofQ